MTSNYSHIPLVMDLDGTLTPVDTLMESVVRLIKQNPLLLFVLPFWLFGGIAQFKRRVADRVCLDPAALPYWPEVLAYIRDERALGRKVVLATATHESIALAVSAHLRLFDQVLATKSNINLREKNKLAAIRAEVGHDFVYAGDSAMDLPVWAGATASVLVGLPAKVRRAYPEQVPVEKEFTGAPRGLSVWLRAVRWHQWLKNILIFVPLLTAFSFMQVSDLVTAGLAFFAFSFAASATYIVNDLLDLDNDRAHPRKRNRPFAAGHLPILRGLAVSGTLLTVAGVLAYSISTSFLWMLLLYLVLTTTYSVALKSVVLLDVVTLAVLYTLRIAAGAVAISVEVSPWLAAFSVFVFLSLALVKRCAELVALVAREKEHTPGRDYRVGDLAVLWPLGVSTAIAAVVVFGLFISAPETQARYASPQLLWGVGLGLVYWLSSLWVKTVRGAMHDDPVVYAVTDRTSVLTLLTLVGLTLVAHFVSVGNT